jgi:two-component system OmpR family response regulator
MAHLLIVEDDELLRDGLSAQLMQAGHRVATAQDGNAALQMLQSTAFEGVVLDLGLPHIDGLTVLRRLRERLPALPVLILTARDGIEDRVEGLNAGADDYLTKPFHLEELLARLRALIRRASGQASPVLQCGALALDTRSGRVTLDGQPVTLTSHEYKVLAYLMHRPGTVVSRSELVEHIYAQDFDRDSNTIEVFVGRLRKKLPQACIETVRGLGYRLAPPPPPPP